MKFSCEKALLSAAVSVASRAVAAKSSIPAMEGILIEAGSQLNTVEEEKNAMEPLADILDRVLAGR